MYAVVVVARLGQTTRDRIRRTTTALSHVNANIAGVVPNGAIEREDSAYYYAYRYRSIRQRAEIPYRDTDTRLEQEPSNLRPAFRANGDAHVPSSEPEGITPLETGDSEPSGTVSPLPRLPSGPPSSPHQA